MAQYKVENLTFTYPDVETPVLNHITFEIEEGALVIVCGKSGCGKTTLLRNLKKETAPHGERSGSVIFEGNDFNASDSRKNAGTVGFVFQNPAHQIVTDKVWHELAFGLENMGVSEKEIGLRVAEMADYFSLTEKLDDDVEELSGGQKQLLNIASIMVMQPKVIILDEPTAQLDPIAADQLMTIISKINRDFGTTILMSEHRLGQVWHMADKVIVLDKGEMTAMGNPREVALHLQGTEFFDAMPQAVKLFAKYGNAAETCPLTIGEARKWLMGHENKEQILEEIQLTYNDKRKQEDTEQNTDVERRIDIGRHTDTERRTYTEKCTDTGSKKYALKVRDVWFRYERHLPDVLKGASLKIYPNEIFGIVGGNGSGKSTLLSVICGLLKPYRGTVKVQGKISMLVQDVQCLFLRDTVREELCDGGDYEQIASRLELDRLLEVHPYDLSGGEQQKLGFAKVLMTNSDIIILDEPTKGMDEVFKNRLGEMLLELRKEGKTIIVVSHDVDFMAQYTDRCGMLFRGQIISENATDKFIENNRYYTTDFQRIVK